MTIGSAAALLGGLYLAVSVRFALRRDDQRARLLLVASLLYLPGMLAVMFCKVAGAG